MTTRAPTTASASELSAMKELTSLNCSLKKQELTPEAEVDEAEQDGDTDRADGRQEHALE